MVLQTQSGVNRHQIGIALHGNFPTVSAFWGRLQKRYFALAEEEGI